MASFIFAYMIWLWSGSSLTYRSFVPSWFPIENTRQPSMKANPKRNFSLTVGSPFPDIIYVSRSHFRNMYRNSDYRDKSCKGTPPRNNAIYYHSENLQVSGLRDRALPRAGCG